MKKSFSELKADARQSLLGHYSTVIAALLIAEIIAGVISIPFSRMIQEGSRYLVPSRILCGTAGMFFVSLITILLSAGVTRIHMMIGRGQDTSLKELGYPFRMRPDRYIGFGVLVFAVAVVSVLPGSIVIGTAAALSSDTYTPLLLIIIGSALIVIGSILEIVILFSWAMTIYLFLDNEQMRVKEALRESRRLMKGNKWRLFVLSLSFIGWLLFGLLSFGIGLLWIAPYYSQTQTGFYFSLLPPEQTGAHEQTAEHAQNLF